MLAKSRKPGWRWIKAGSTVPCRCTRGSRMPCVLGIAAAIADPSRRENIACGDGVPDRSRASRYVRPTHSAGDTARRCLLRRYPTSHQRRARQVARTWDGIAGVGLSVGRWRRCHRHLVIANLRDRSWSPARTRELSKSARFRLRRLRAQQLPAALAPVVGLFGRQADWSVGDIQGAAGRPPSQSTSPAGLLDYTELRGEESSAAADPLRAPSAATTSRCSANRQGDLLDRSGMH